MQLIFLFFIGTVIAMALMSLLIISLFNRFISRPIKVILHGINELKEGKLNSRIDIDSQDELGQISDSINALNDQIKEVVGNIVEETVNLQQASSELKQKSVELSVMPINSLPLPSKLLHLWKKWFRTYN